MLLDLVVKFLICFIIIYPLIFLLSPIGENLEYNRQNIVSNLIFITILGYLLSTVNKYI